MKKTYSAPVAEIYQIRTSGMLAESVIVDNDTTVGADESLSKEYQGKSFLWEEDE